jgi:hypothetical protein
MKIVHILLVVMSISWSTSAQEFKPSLAPDYAIGIVAGYHFQKDHNKIELGISKAGTVHAAALVAYAISTEYCKINNEGSYGFTASAWMTAGLSFGLATTYSTDFDSKDALSFRPMIGLGIFGFQVVYEYDLFIIKPDYDFGPRNRIAIRLNIGLFEMD